MPVKTAVPPLSQSRQSLMACPHLYRERAILGKQEAPNEYSQRGIEIHRAIASYVNHLVETKQSRDDAFFSKMLTSQGFGAEALQILESYRGSLAIDPEKVLGTELYLALGEDLESIDFDLDDGGDISPMGGAEVAFEGTLDYVQCPDAKTADIFDWKSFYQIIDADTFQSRLYPLLLFKHYPSLERVHFYLQFVRYGVSRSAEYTRDDVSKLELLVSGERGRQLALHNEGDMRAAADAMPGNHCAWCPLLQQCPLGTTNPMTQNPVELARFGVWLMQAAKQNTAALKALVNVQGPIVIADANGTSYEAGFHLQQKSSYPARACYPVIERAEPELLDKLTISGLSAPLKTKKRAKLAEQLAGLKTTSAQTRFSIRGVDGDNEDGE